MSLEFRTLQPEEFYRQHIEAGVRPDGRQLGERRAMAVSAGNISTVTSSSHVSNYMKLCLKSMQLKFRLMGQQ